MKKITKLLLMTAIAIGMVACSNDDNLPDAPDANAAKGNTYASISIKLPKAPSARVLPKGPSTRVSLPDDYNNKGTWEGNDLIEKVNVYLVNETYGTIDNATFGTDQFDAIDTNGVLSPNVALKATAGHNVKAYVVLNGNADVINSLNAATTLAAFNAIYANAVAKNASVLASNNGTKDVIMMTNTEEPVGITVLPNVSESDAIAGTKNSVKVEVERVVSRALATVATAAKTATISVKAADGTEGSKITIKSIEYGVGQSNKEFFMTKQTGYVTPIAVYEHVPSVDTWKPALFDYTGLEDSTEVKTATGGTSITQFETALKEEGTASKFVLPVTHEDGKYEKGNTTYFEVTAIFTPNAVIDDGSFTYNDGDDVFLGMNDGKFYNTRALAVASGQKATMYRGTGTADGGAIMKYVLWLNPDIIPGTPDKKATMSPTVRNQVYHAHITGFKQIGLPNNPLNPNEPDEFGDNPINPIKPEDPLQTEDTYLSVQITVLDWGIHSYEINLGNDY